MRTGTEGRSCPTTRVALLALLTLSGSGCGSDALSSPTAKNLRHLANLYLSYADSKGHGQGPRREEDFKAYVHRLPEFLLRNSGVDPKSVDALFVSERDQQPVVVVYGVGVKGITPTMAPLVAYEQSGKRGKRLVVYANTKVEEVDDARLRQLTAAGP
jgi:hypothetical protein